MISVVAFISENLTCKLLFCVLIINHYVVDAVIFLNHCVCVCVCVCVCDLYHLGQNKADKIFMQYADNSFGENFPS